MSIGGLNWPGGGTMKLAAADVGPITTHEMAKPRAAELDKALAENADLPSDGWRRKYRAELGALLDAADRPIVPDDLTYAAAARCRCGAGYCYPKFIHDPHGHWYCSALMTGTAAADSEHDLAKPFAFWSIKGENQPSAGGATTRPAKVYTEEPGRDYRKERDAAYTERNRVVAALARIMFELRRLNPAIVEPAAWLADHQDEPGVDWDPEWRTVVFIETEFGQLSWHLHDSDVPLFKGLPRGPNTWDGHTTAQKYDRLDKLGRGY